jgi:RimJ/RimL family protein N-acetyltransferase
MYLTCLKSTGEPIGVCGIVKRDNLDCPDIGYALMPEFGGKGYATEAALAVMDYGTNELGIKCIVGITSIENKASINVLEKLGLKFEKMVPYSETEESMLFFPS